MCLFNVLAAITPGRILSGDGGAKAKVKYESLAVQALSESGLDPELMDQNPLRVVSYLGFVSFNCVISLLPVLVPSDPRKALLEQEACVDSQLLMVCSLWGPPINRGLECLTCSLYNCQQ